MKNNYDICIIGGGVVGCAIARELSRYELKTVLLEAESDVAEGISKANSGVLHAGFNVKSGSLKARFNVAGLDYFPGICYDLDVPYRNCKKLVIAKDDEELKTLEKLYDQGLRNNCKGLSIIKKDKINRLEPHVKAEYALFSEKTGIISPYIFTIALAENALANGVEIYLNSKVINIIKNDNVFFIKTENGYEYKSKIIINAAGMFSDKIANLAAKHEYKIYPCRGEYYIMDTEASSVLHMAVYPVPPKDGSGLGVHLTPTVNNGIMIGPSADYINERTDTANTKPVMDALKKEAYELLPLLKNYSFIKNFSGIRPKLFTKEDDVNFKDFVIEESSLVENLINLIGIESPGLTSAPAISKYVVESLISKKIDLKNKKNFIKKRKGIIRTKNIEQDKLQDLYKIDKNYGEVVCRCEQVTKAEILQAVNNPLGVKTLNGIKRRTHSMMGRCQGGFCKPRISNILQNEFDLKPEEIVNKNKKSYLFTSCENGNFAHSCENGNFAHSCENGNFAHSCENGNFSHGVKNDKY